MFTGIIEDIGEVVVTQQQGGDLRLRVRSKAMDLSEVQLGDSIATNGVCLTVVELPGDGYWADVSVETLDNTTVGQWQVGQTVNLERALTPSSRLGGHIVSGHVDGVGEVVSRVSEARCERIRILAPQSLAKYIAHKGSITVDGTSLTVNVVDGSAFELNIVPHTLEKTALDQYRSGTRVNLEVDIIARYLERLLLGNKGSDENGSEDGSAISLEFLAENGFYRGG